MRFFGRLRLLAFIALSVGFSTPALAGGADVESVEAILQGDSSWRFNVTVRHADEGWQHYADRWDIVAPDGRVLGTRVLLHPHEQEQPFTRSLGGVFIPPEVKRVRVRAHDSVHGLGGKEIEIELDR